MSFSALELSSRDVLADAVSHCMARYFVLTCSVPLVTSGVGALMIAVVSLLTRQGMLVGALTAGRCSDGW